MKRLEDLSIEQMTEAILRKEPSAENIRRKSLLMLRGSITGIARLQIVLDARLGPSARDLFSKLLCCIEHVALVTRFLDELNFAENKGTAATEPQSNNGQDLP